MEENYRKNLVRQVVAMFGMVCTSIFSVNEIENLAAWEFFFVETALQKRNKRKNEELEAMPVMKKLFSFAASPQKSLYDIETDYIN